MNTSAGVQQEKRFINKLYSYINEEKLTKDYSSYQLNKIERYFDFIDEIANASTEEQKEILTILAEYKKQENEGTVLGRLIPPILAFRQSIEKDPSEEEQLFELLISLLQDFQLYTRWSIIIAIADRVLSFFPSEIGKLKNHPQIADILRFKQDAVEKLQGKKETREILKMIIEIDRKDADSCVKYAKLIFHEDPEQAGIYLKRSAEIYVRDKKISKLEDIWKILVENYFEDLKFFERLERLLNSSKEYNFIVAHFPQLIGKYKEIEEWDIVIYLLKKVIVNAQEQERKEANSRRLLKGEKRYKKKEGRALSRLREELTKAYRNKYKEHSLLDVFLKLSELTNPKKPIQIGISNFEKYIVFDAGNYVYHRKRGVGKIKEINEKYVIIDFEKNPGQKMTLDMAISSLQALEQSHIWVRYVENKEELAKICKENKLEFFKILLESYNKKISLSQVKAEVVGKGLIKASDWNKWWTDARKLLKESNLFGFSPRKRDEILMWERELSYSEELENRFQNLKEWDKKLEVALESLIVSPEVTEKASEAFAEFFISQEETKDSVKKIQIFLFLELFEKTYPTHTINKQRKLKKENILQLLANIGEEQIKKIFYQIKNTDFKKQYIGLIIEAREDYPEILKSILLETPIKVHKYIIEQLERHGKIDVLKDFINTVFRKYREYPEIFLWLARNILENNWSQEYEWIQKEKLEVLLQVFRLLKPLVRIETKGNRLKNLALETIFGTQNITVENLAKSKIKEYIETLDEEVVKRMYILFRDVPESYIKEAHKENFLQFIQQIRPEIANVEFTLDTEPEAIPEEESFIPSDDIIYVTRKGLEEKKKYLDKLINVDMKENSREIAEAQEKGDLRENAEYKAALERQDKLKAEIEKLQKDIKKAKVMEFETIQTDRVRIGTKITVRDQDGNQIQYTILGPWEIDAEKNIISYQAPIARALIGKKVGETAILEKQKKSFVVEKIEKSDLVQ